MTMPYLPLRSLPDRSSRGAATEWLSTIERSLRDASTDRSRLCREGLTPFFYPQYADNWETAVEDASLPPATRLSLAAMDPRNITLEPEYYGECDDAKFQ